MICQSSGLSRLIWRVDSGLTKMLTFFRVQLERDPHAVFLIISKEPRRDIIAAAAKNGVPESRSWCARRPAPKYQSCLRRQTSDLLHCPHFRRRRAHPPRWANSSHSNCRSSPTANVGDVGRIVAETGCGVVVLGSTTFLRTALDELERLSQKSAGRRHPLYAGSISRQESAAMTRSIAKLKKNFRGP